MNAKEYELRIKRMYIERVGNIEKFQPTYWDNIRSAAVAFVGHSRINFLTFAEHSRLDFWR